MCVVALMPSTYMLLQILASLPVLLLLKCMSYLYSAKVGPS